MVNMVSDILYKKEMFYLTMLSTHFIYGYMVSENIVTEGNVLFNNTLNTFYLWLCDV